MLQQCQKIFDTFLINKKIYLPRPLMNKLKQLYKLFADAAFACRVANDYTEHSVWGLNISFVNHYADNVLT